MSWVVCKFKDDGSLFVCSRRSREITISCLIDIGQEIESVVVKEFETYGEAIKYKIEIDEVDKKINEL